MRARLHLRCSAGFWIRLWRTLQILSVCFSVTQDAYFTNINIIIPTNGNSRLDFRVILLLQLLAKKTTKSISFALNEGTIKFSSKSNTCSPFKYSSTFMHKIRKISSAAVQKNTVIFRPTLEYLAPISKIELCHFFPT